MCIVFGFHFSFQDCSTSLSMVEASPPPKVPALKQKVGFAFDYDYN